MFYGDKVLNSHFTKKTNTLALIFSIFVCLKPQLAICQGGGEQTNIKNEIFNQNHSVPWHKKTIKLPPAMSTRYLFIRTELEVPTQ